MMHGHGYDGWHWHWMAPMMAFWITVLAVAIYAAVSSPYATNATQPIVPEHRADGRCGLPVGCTRRSEPRGE